MTTAMRTRNQVPALVLIAGKVDDRLVLRRCARAIYRETLGASCYFPRARHNCIGHFVDSTGALCRYNVWAHVLC